MAKRVKEVSVECMLDEKGSEGGEFLHFIFPARESLAMRIQSPIQGGIYIKKGFPIPEVIHLTPLIPPQEGG